MSRLWQENQARRLRDASPRLPPALADLAAVSRALGADPALASHGGGNTSIKLTENDAFGRRIPVLRIKPSGAELAELGPADFVALDHEALRRVATLETLGGEKLLAVLSAARLDPRAPLPSVEALLHAVIDAPVVLHAHAEAVLGVAGQPDGASRIRALLGPSAAVADYAMPGLELAQAALAALAASPGAECLIFRRHGIFAWGADPRAAAMRLERAVDACEGALPPAAPAPKSGPTTSPQAASERVAELAPRLRGALTETGETLPRRPVLSWCGDGETLALLEALAVDKGGAPGPLTPDHVIHTGFRPLQLEPGGDDLAVALAGWRRTYAAYASPAGPESPGYDARPRVVLVPGCGIFGVGDDAGRARAAVELTRRGLTLTARARRLGEYEGPAADELRELEFWAAEQAKLKRPGSEIRGRVAFVTGAAGAIGAGVAGELARAGAAVLLSDLVTGPSDDRLERAAARVVDAGADAEAVACLPCDVTDPAQVERSFADAARRFGGADLLVLSHGMAEVAPIDSLDPCRLQQVFSVNALGAFHVLAAFVRQVRSAGRGGDVVLISTKNVPDPGASFSAYSASKAAAHQLARVAALELAGDDLRVNLVAPDAVFGDEEIPSRLWQEVGPGRARSKGIDPGELPEHYRQRNLLRTRVRVADVARAVLFFARRSTPTTGAVLPVDGGLPGAFPR